MTNNYPFGTVLLFDGSYLIHRNSYTFPNLKNAAGEHTGGLYGAIKTINKAIRDFNPLQIVVCLDTVRTSFRNDIYPAYKQNRDERSPEIQKQMELLQDFCLAAQIPCFDAPEYEADDFLGTLTLKAVEEGYSPYIVSGDKDLYQMISYGAKVVIPKDGNYEIVDKKSFEDKFDGLTPDKMPELKGLAGDSGDNIPGVTKIGEKTAIKILKDYPDLETVYENIESFKGKQKENLINDRDMAFMSRTLGIIKKDIEIVFPDSVIFNMQSDTAFEFLQRYQIVSI